MTTEPSKPVSLAEGFVEQRGEIFAFEMVLHREQVVAVRATVADSAMWLVVFRYGGSGRDAQA